MLSAIAIGAGILVAALLGIAAARPNGFRVQRSRKIEAPPNTIFALLQDFQQWPAWSPYEKSDPAMTREYSGPPSSPCSHTAIPSRHVGHVRSPALSVQADVAVRQHGPDDR